MATTEKENQNLYSKNKALSNFEYAIDVKGLKKYFKSNGDIIKAVDGLDLKVRKGEVFGFLGPNGAGKTTAINIFCGLLDFDDGEVKIGGFDVSTQPREVKMRIGVCPQEPSLYSFMTGRQNLTFFGELHGIDKAVLKSRSDDLLEKISLNSAADRKLKTYSGGMIRRINTIVALISNPEIVFLDEPTVAMDPQSRHSVWDFILSLKNDGKTVILTTHYIEEADFLCDQVGIIDTGKIIELGNPKSLKEKYSAQTLEDVFIQLTGKRIREESM